MELHAIFPVRSNGWAEIYFGNVTFDLHPCARPDGLYQHVGETAFVTQLKRDTIQYVISHPAQFAGKSFVRAIRFWFVPLNFLPLTADPSLGGLGWLGDASSKGSVARSRVSTGAGFLPDYLFHHAH